MIAKNLGIPVLIVGAGNGKKKKDFINTMQITYNSFISKEVDVVVDFAICLVDILHLAHRHIWLVWIEDFDE